MIGRAGVLERTAIEGADSRDDDIVACVFWQDGRVLAGRAPPHTGDVRITQWLAWAACRVGPCRPLAVLTLRELG